MPRKAATQEQIDEARANLRRAASVLYRKNGLSGISARAVAEQAGVSIGTIYKYFDNLTLLMQSLWMERVDKLNDAFTEALEGLVDPHERIRAILGTYVAFARNNPDFYKGAMMYVRPSGDAKPETFAFDTLPMVALLKDAIEEGQAQGTIKSGSSAELIQLLWSALHGSLTLPINLDRVDFADADVLPELMIETLTDMLKP